MMDGNTQGFRAEGTLNLFKAFANGTKQHEHRNKDGGNKVIFFLRHTHICLVNGALIRTAAIIVAKTNFSSLISKRSG